VTLARNIIVASLKIQSTHFSRKKTPWRDQMRVCAAPLFRYVNCAKYFRSSAIVRPRIKESEMDYSGASERRYISETLNEKLRSRERR
jgi:hypothetical protein